METHLDIWEADVADHDYDAANTYLTLRYDEHRAAEVCAGLRKSKLTDRRANDILRACGRDPLPLDDPGVKRDLMKVITGKKLSPVLVASFRDAADIADGYHRISLSYHLDPFAALPLRIFHMDERQRD